MQPAMKGDVPFLLSSQVESRHDRILLFQRELPLRENHLFISAKMGDKYSMDDIKDIRAADGFE